MPHCCLLGTFGSARGVFPWSPNGFVLSPGVPTASRRDPPEVSEILPGGPRELLTWFKNIFCSFSLFEKRFYEAKCLKADSKLLLESQSGPPETEKVSSVSGALMHFAS